jgi:hypothetical protein
MFMSSSPEFVHCKRGFVGVTKLGILSWEDFPGISGTNVIMKEFIRVRWVKVRWKRCDHRSRCGNDVLQRGRKE